MAPHREAPTAAEPFTVDVPDEVLEDLRRRLEATRWPDDLGNADWRYGAQRTYLEEVVAHWLASYDWREHERRINTYANFRATIDGIPIHFIHERGTGPAPIPLVLTHGWPWSFWDFEKVIGPLTDPASHGGDPADAFDVVVPSLPGFGFSVPLPRTGVNFMTTADLWVTLMRDVLGYDRFAAQGGDWGQLVASQLGHKHHKHLIGIHVNLSLPLDFFEATLPERDDYEDDERHFFHHTQKRMARAISHLQVQSIDPQNLAYGLTDSPVGLLAWLLDRRRFWSDSGGDVERRFSKDDTITLAMLYWLNGSIASTLRFYYEAAHDPWRPVDDQRPVVKAPTAMAVFPQELIVMPRRWMENYYDLRQLTYMEAGGHFAPAEEPEALVEDVRRFFRLFRSGAAPA
jgi:pimeloyl-ACP methyl ester carboxylesterase